LVTTTQAGCALALLLVVPLGDRFDRRLLMIVQSLGLVGALLLVGYARLLPTLAIGMLGVGMLGTAMTQGLIAYAASTAAPSERGAVVGAAQGGVFVGLLLARVFAGAVSDQLGWRGVYFCAATIQLGFTYLLWRKLPSPAVQANTLRYPELLGSMFTLLRTERTLQIRGMLALLMFAAFNIFWSALTLVLSAAPYRYSHTLIGAFGLAGVAGALAATRAGRLADLGLGQRTTLMALAALLLAWWPLSALHVSLWALIIGIVVLDLGGQALHVTNQSMILDARPEASGRMIGLYMLFYAVGSGLGAIGATFAYARAGWNGVCSLGAAVSLMALLFWTASRRWMPAGRPSQKHDAHIRLKLDRADPP
jgi:predicted MFS family arabinose efflux permease